MKKMPMLRKRMQQQQSPTTTATTAVATRGRVVFGPMVLWVAIVLSFLLLLSAPMGSLAFLPSAQNNKYKYNYKYNYNYETNGRNDRHTIPRHATAESDSDASTIIEEDSESTSTSSTTTTPSTSTTTTRGRRRSAFRANVKRLLFSPGSSSSSNNNKSEASPSIATPSSFSQQQQIQSIDAAFAPAENALDELEASLTNAREALRTAKAEALLAMERLQSQSQSATTTTTTTAASTTDEEELDFSDTYTDLSSLTFDDIDYESSEMAPPFLDPNSCLLPDAEPVVRVEKAPENSRRIFAGIDILASADDVWNVLTNYAELQNVIPNLVVNDVLALYDEEEEEGTSASTDDDNDDDESLPEAVRCERLSKTRKGSLLRQVGGAKVAGIRFSATTTLEVREWPNGLPDFAHFADDVWEGRSREARARDLYSTRTPLQRYRFPRPFCISELPTRDISMQSTEDDDGEFRLYQGVWRMQPLVGCSPPGQHAMRLTYAVEISPRPYLPVRLVEGRIVKDLCSNLEAIRAAVTAAAAGNNKE